MEKTLKNAFFKKLQKASYLSSTDATFVDQLGVRVQPEMINMHPAQDPFRARLAPRDQVNSDRAATYVTLDEIDFITASDAFFEEGGCPPSVRYGTTMASKVKKHFGVEGGITNAAIAAMNGAQNVQGIDNEVLGAAERTLRTLDIAYRNSLEWAMINGNEAVSPLAFDGLAQEISAANGSLVVDLSGADVTRSLINQIVAVQALRGVRVTAIVTNPLMVDFIKEQYHPSGLATPIMSANAQFDPYSFASIPGPNGPVDLVGSPAVPVTYVSGSDYTADIYLICETHNGVDLLYMDYLIPQTILPNGVFSDGSNCTSTDFGMYAVGTLVNRAPVAQAKILNAGFNANSGLSSQIVALSGERI